MTVTQESDLRTLDEDGFRARVEAFLSTHATRRRSRRRSEGEEAGVDADLEAARDPESQAEIGAAKAYQGALYDAGLAFLTWPARFGGAELDKRHQELFNEVAADYELPTGIFQIGHGMCAPIILQYGTEEQQERYLRPLLRGDDIWCQLYSEPGAGSDVASLQTRAVRDGDEYVISGQKVWTSGAHYSDFGIIIARTNPEAPKHKGISMFIVDMTSPGIEPRPLRQITGAANFNEVFLTDVRVPASNLLGDENDGWRLAVALLMNERVAIGASGDGPRNGGVQPLIHLARATGQIGDPVVRQELMRVHIGETLMRFMGMRIRAAQQAGRAPGPEGSLAKLAGAILARQASDLGLQLAGSAGQAWTAGDDKGARWAIASLSAPASAIAGGTNEIQRNIIGERVLGLPKEPSVDREQPFKDLKVGTQR